MGPALLLANSERPAADARRTPLRPGDIVVSSELGSSCRVWHRPVPQLATVDIARRCPFRLIGLESHSAYSTVSEGYLPFGGLDATSSTALRAVQVVRAPSDAGRPHRWTRPLPPTQIVSGIFSLEGKIRWTSQDRDGRA